MQCGRCHDAISICTCCLVWATVLGKLRLMHRQVGCLSGIADVLDVGFRSPRR
jgi:hypothetical protein